MMIAPVCPPAGDCLYVAALIRDWIRDTPGLGAVSQDSEAAALQRVEKFLRKLGAQERDK